MKLAYVLGYMSLDMTYVVHVLGQLLHMSYIVLHMSCIGLVMTYVIRYDICCPYIGSVITHVIYCVTYVMY